MKNDKYVGNVVLVKLPNNIRPTYRWIVRKTENGRYIARSPKIGVLIRDLNKKLEKDYNSEHYLPKNSLFWEPLSKRKSTTQKK